MQSNSNNKKPLRKLVKPGIQQQKNNRSKKAALCPDLFIQQAVAPVINQTVIKTRFEHLDLTPSLKNKILDMGFVSPTEIQEKTLPVLLEGKNLIGIANTGTGKTGAFLIPVVERLLRNKETKFQSLIIVPTRELALQVYDEFVKLSGGLNLRAACYIGGTNVEKDLLSLRKSADIVIGTPGRLLDLTERGALKLSRFEVLILDEFDKMLDMGFVRDIRKLVNGMNRRKQTILFSATKDPKQQSIISEIVKEPVLVEIHSGDKSSRNVDQDIIRVSDGQDKYLLLLKLLKDQEFDKVILFTETKHLANKLAKKLNDSGIKSDQIHGNKSQNYRVSALGKFKNGSIRVLVATDVAARGIDVNDVSLVINYQAPADFDTYIHRVGRTGRAGKTGTAYTFVD
jgi:ATP-dependent RNA helicase RhlE